jgi:predicted ester cyclase
MTGNIIFRFEDGKVAEAWSFADMLGLMQQIGVSSPARPTPADYTWTSRSAATGNPGEPEANKAMVRRFVEEAWNQQNLDMMDGIFASDVVSHNPPIEFLYGPSDLEVLKQGVADYLAAYPDLEVVMTDLVAEGDLVSALWTASGTHLGELMGMVPTGNPVTFSGITMYRFADGKIVEMWWAWDTLGMMQQISPPAE